MCIEAHLKPVDNPALLCLFTSANHGYIPWSYLCNVSILVGEKQSQLGLSNLQGIVSTYVLTIPYNG